MADDRHEAYRAMFTRQYLQEIISNVESEQELASIMYDAIEIALHKEHKWPHPTVRGVLHEALELNKRIL
jgi:hypothetical protein